MDGVTMNIIDLFSGCGGLSHGFTQAGYNVLAAYDFWQPAIDTYNANFNHPAIKFDLSDTESFLKSIASQKVDMIMGGPPCQDFSSAGKRVEGDRANLTTSYSEIICQIRPEFFLMENVARASSSSAYKLARSRFVEAGYGLTEVVLDASRCGVPQARKRFICVGHLGSSDNFLSQIIETSLSKQRLTVREYLGSELDVEHYYRHPRNYNRRGVYSIDEPAATIRGVSRPVPKGYKGHSNDTAPINSGIRALTTSERARIQTFPANYKWVGSKTDVEQMIGNAVPVNLARFVAQCICEYQKSITNKAA